MADGILVALDSAMIIYTDENGEQQRAYVHKGVTRVREGHPMLEGREELFGPIDVHYDVEQATRGPGERRAGRRKAED